MWKLDRELTMLSKPPAYTWLHACALACVGCASKPGADLKTAAADLKTLEPPTFAFERWAPQASDACAGCWNPRLNE
jgi:hypothetical protein